MQLRKPLDAADKAKAQSSPFCRQEMTTKNHLNLVCLEHGTEQETTSGHCVPQRVNVDYQH